MKMCKINKLKIFTVYLLRTICFVCKDLITPYHWNASDMDQYYSNFNSIEFVQLNLNQILTSRQTVFKTLKNNVFKIGMNSLTNRLTHINDIVPLSWLNMSIDTYKVHCKKLFLCWLKVDNSPYGPYYFYLIILF